MRYSGAVAFAMAVVVLISVGTCGSSRPKPAVRVGTNVWIGYEPLHAAAADGRLGPELRLVEYVSATQVLRGFENGDIDAAAVTLDEALRLASTTHDVQLIAVLDVSTGGDAVIARPPRTTLAHLAGARIAVEHTAVGELVLRRALERARLKRADVEVVPTPANEHLAAWDAGVDAVVTFEPVRSRLLALGGVELLSSGELPGEIVDVLVARRSLVKARPGLGRQLAATWFALRSWVQAEPERFSRLAAPRLRVTEAEVRRQLSTLRFPDEAESQAGVGGALVATAKAYLPILGDEAGVTGADVDDLFSAEAR